MEIISSLSITINFKAFNYTFPIEIKTNEEILQSIQIVSTKFNIEQNNLEIHDYEL